MIIEDYSNVESWSWRNFSPKELACPCCRELYVDEDAIDRLQYARDDIDKPIVINSAHRCGIHNARVGGAPLSRHKSIAFDLRLKGHNKADLFQSLQNAGFTSFGLYQSFIHADTRPGRLWYGIGAREIWIS